MGPDLLLLRGSEQPKAELVDGIAAACQGLDLSHCRAVLVLVGAKRVGTTDTCSPDLIAIEEAFLGVKVCLRRAEACSHEALVEAIGQGLSAITSRDARGFFGHCGYRISVQPL